EDVAEEMLELVLALELEHLRRELELRGLVQRRLELTDSRRPEQLVQALVFLLVEILPRGYEFQLRSVEIVHAPLPVSVSVAQEARASSGPTAGCVVPMRPGEAAFVGRCSARSRSERRFALPHAACRDAEPIAVLRNGPSGDRNTYGSEFPRELGV